MSNYLVLSKLSELQINNFNRELFRLLRPDHVKNPDDVTEFFTSIVKHPITGDMALFMSDKKDYIHIDTNGVDLADIIGSIVPVAEKNKLVNDVVNNRGNIIKIRDILPITLISFIKTKEELDTEGWFPALGPLIDP